MSTNFLSQGPGPAAPAKPSGPTSEAGPRQQDGTVSPMGKPPTRLHQVSREPSREVRSGIERAMGAQADQLHRPKRR